MNIAWPGFDVYAYTGGKTFNPGQPTVVFIHGVLCDHSVWVLQSRYLAHHGWNVLAIDISIRHQYDLVIAQLIDVEVVLHTSAKRRDQRLDFSVS